ncbi:NADH-quinone oxidoreductase subunit L [Pseudidiomarina insulisalsae]|uniref:Probable inorganic carbon transporter subunit DabB n=1 Tax=Pseudidiomarina insulisalsae TaxID=575789 RepID=A0A432YMW2_9GAMM|nr:NADH-quinone oxidoreductase subunit L [Pseudidiomarina insulisalsae]RUO62195.1 NADH-quinone oxidoreductase subunit L [Pseudidiomarina insulisalsae]
MPWRGTQLVLLAFLLALLAACVAVASGLSAPIQFFGFALTPLSSGFAAMICFIAWVVTRYAATQFRDEQDAGSFKRRLIATIAAILVTSLADHFVLFWLGWVAVSLTLHRLLVFYPERPRAMLAAHKKFIFARIAETLLAAALLTLYFTYDITRISELSFIADHSVSNWVAILLVTVAAMKCAQLPVHGWLLQVVEAPTPVSALLHAGIINLGGYLLLQFSEVLTPAEGARWLLAVIAGLSMLVAASVTMTRISVKVRLAWSTVAQMALMLVEISLGFYALAALHLLAHSCYKAYAFLSAGSAVEQHERQVFAQLELPSFRALLGGAVIATVLVVAAAYLLTTQLYIAPWLAVGMALALWLASEVDYFGRRHLIRTLAISAFWLGLYLIGALLLKALLTTPVAEVYLLGIDIWVCFVLLGIASVYLWLLYRPRRALGHRLFIALNAGLYLDEWATRLSLRIWPLRLPKGEQS